MSTYNPTQRRRRFPERSLLDRIRQYEDLLKRHNIPFEPLHSAMSATAGEHDEEQDGSQHGDDALSDRPAALEGTDTRPKTFWEAVRHPDTNATENVDEELVKTSLNRMFPDEGLLLFGPPIPDIQLSAAHPSQVDIFKLWQIYLDNVDPLLKVTHTPTLQSRIVRAAGDLANMAPSLEALMFAIYCVAVLSLSDAQCLAEFSSTKKWLLPALRQACYRALQKCQALRSESLDALTALFLYHANPRSLSSALAVPIRAAQRMGLDNEAVNAKHPPFEAETRRRIWWAMAAFDDRVAEISMNKVRVLNGPWDCSLPANSNDSDIYAGMDKVPTAHQRPTEAMFAVMYARLYDHLRYSQSHQSFTMSSFGSAASKRISPADLDGFLRDLEKSCDERNPLHQVTILTAKRLISKMKLMDFSCRPNVSGFSLTDKERDAAITAARNMIESDTELMTSSSIAGFKWYAELHLPFPAYMHVVKDLLDRPLAEHIDETWHAFSASFRARKLDENSRDHNPVVTALGGLIVKGWASREKALAERTLPPGVIPDVVSHFRQHRQDEAARPISAATVAQTSPNPDGVGMFNASLFGGIDTWGTTELDFDISSIMNTSSSITNDTIFQ